MARPRQDGTPARAVDRKRLSDVFVTARRGGDRDEMIWDLKQPGLALSVRTTGKKAWKVVYRFHGRLRWLHSRRQIDYVADARRLTAKVMLDVMRAKTRRPSEGRAGVRHLRRSGEPVCRAVRQEAQQQLEAGRGAGAPSFAAALGQGEGNCDHEGRCPRGDGPNRSTHRR
jgi:hypothetical protein